MGGLTIFRGRFNILSMQECPAERQNVFVIIPVHNRREITLGCLGCLKAAGILDWAEVIVVDDGSTDGTAAGIRDGFPQVHILQGDGNLWWTGGIVLGMKEAMRRKAAVIVWLNDDCHPRPGALKALVNHTLETGALSVGQTFSSTGESYTGWVKTPWGQRPVGCPPGQFAFCDTCPGNFVALPGKVVEAIGYPDARSFPHIFADADYGFEASRRGFQIHVLGDARADGIDSVNPRSASWLLDERPAGQILSSLLHRTSSMHPRTFWRYLTRHWRCRGALRWAGSYVRLALFLAAKSIIPRRWLLRWVGRRSVAWKVALAAEKRIASAAGHECASKSAPPL